MAAVSACSTTPRGEEGFVDTLADAGSRTWDRTMYLLGFDEAAKEKTRQQELDRAMAARSESHLLDEVDLALLKEDAPPLENPGFAAADDAAGSPSWSAMAADEEETVGDLALGERSSTGDALLPDDLPAASLSADATTVDGEGQAVALDDSVLVTADDLMHVVVDADTLWDIAKATTGDATNWHVLADINDLGPDAAVYPGQELIIPGDMRRPELAAATPAPADSNLSATLDVDLTDDGDPIDVAADLTESDPIDTAATMAESTVMEIDNGETLWDFSKRTTGDATHWQAIAAANAFTDEQATKVRPGQSIRVPDALLRESLASAKDESAPVAAAATEAESGIEPLPTDDLTTPVNPAVAASDDTVGAELEIATSDADGEAPDSDRVEDTRRALELAPIASAVDTAPDAVDPAVDESSETLAAASDPVDKAIAGDDQPIRIVEAAYQTEPEVDVADPAAASDVPSQIMVSGTYYPKAVYNDADFSSSLLMRVPPGTKLQVSRAFGPWFEVETAEGTGFVHARDIR